MSLAEVTRNQASGSVHSHEVKNHGSLRLLGVERSSHRSSLHPSQGAQGSLVNVDALLHRSEFADFSSFPPEVSGHQFQ
jgi:hypothetical protein